MHQLMYNIYTYLNTFPFPFHFMATALSADDKSENFNRLAAILLPHPPPPTLLTTPSPYIGPDKPSHFLYLNRLVPGESFCTALYAYGAVLLL